MATKDTVLAQHGRWSHRRQGEQVTEFIGVFPPSRRDEAMGVSRFLHKSHITQEQRKPEEYSDGYVVRLKSEWGDNLDKFKIWAMGHELLPKLRSEEQVREHGRLMREHEQQERYALAFKPAPRRFARSTIDHLNWELAEAGYGTPAAPMAHTSLVTVTEHPVLAFQVAHFLYREGYMERERFDRLHEEIKHHQCHPEEEAEFRIAVDGKHFARFEQEFPHAGECKPSLDPQWMARLTELSLPSRNRSLR